MTHRLRLDRVVSGAPGLVVWVMANPSTADDTQDDPTIRRCIGFTRRWGYGRLCVVNLSSYRATRPADLERAIRNREPAASFGGPENVAAVCAALAEADLVVAAWGTVGSQILGWLADAGHASAGASSIVSKVRAHPGAVALGLTRNGDPSHPLYVAADTVPLLLSTGTAAPGAWGRAPEQGMLL